ncbi:putative N-formylglutamate amidohydrolase [Rhizobium sp. SG_E_25_P2]|uniref:N-formylglutamate amidohydrolase n=1 Tax=Rhizobium sp. SG_E_25_P2 TaxID=2879942 RepID=UPI0024772490|nr:N-formylglutamate amidohydrolase [Rhizobium sp. SG_E_25_P2]MDH6265425.1 putative N-formylglutamate amidohydrolase [Rhizobium sp. SG_E_25_P2]
MPAETTSVWPAAVEMLNAGGRSPFVLTCEHASRHIPTDYQGLGLPEAEISRHIGWDIGAAAVTRRLSALLDAPAFLSNYSRLLIDLNRPLGAESSIPILSEITVIPGNQDLDAAERALRADRMFHPFHTAVTAHLDERARCGRPALILAIHSFTPVFKGVERPWHAGVLFSHSRDWGAAMVERLGEDGLNIAANQPYVIDRTEDYTIPIHGQDRGLPALLIEIRQDLIGEAAGAEEWAERLARAV